MNKNNELNLIIDQIEATEKKIKTVELDHMDFNKEPKLKRLREDRLALIKGIEHMFKVDKNDYLEVQGTPNPDLYYVITKEIERLKRVRDLIINTNFHPSYFNSDIKHNDSRFMKKIKPIDDCITRYINLAKFVSLINAPDENFVEGIKILYDKEINLDDAGSLVNRITLLGDTDMKAAIYTFYDVVNLVGKMPQTRLESDQYRVFSNIIVEYNLKSAMNIPKLNQSRIEFDSLLNELYPLFSDREKPVDHYDFQNYNNCLSSYDANQLYERLSEYVQLYDDMQVSGQVKGILNDVKNNQQLKDIVNRYQILLNELMAFKDKVKHQEELKELRKKKSVFGKKKREERIIELEKSLDENTNKEKEYDDKNEKIYLAYFNALRKELVDKGISPKKVSKFNTWEELSQDIRRKITNVMSNMAVDSVVMTTDKIIADIFFPFEFYVNQSEERMQDFSKKNNVKDGIEINKVNKYLHMIKNYKMLNDGSNSTTATPYTEKDLTDYYITNSLLAIDNSYQRLNNENVKSKQM